MMLSSQPYRADEILTRYFRHFKDLFSASLVVTAWLYFVVEDPLSLVISRSTPCIYAAGTENYLIAWKGLN